VEGRSEFQALIFDGDSGLAVLRSFFIIFVSVLLLGLGLMAGENTSCANSLSEIHQGDLILNGDNVTIIEGRFDVNGSIIVEDNATLILRNAIVNFTQTSNNQFGMTFENPTNGNPRLIVENATLTSTEDPTSGEAYYFFVNFHANSSCIANHLEAWMASTHFWLYESSHMFMSDSHVYAIIDYEGFFGTNSSTVNYLQVFESASANASSSNIDSLLSYSSGNVIVSDSTINSLSTGFQYKSLIQLVNSTCDQYTIDEEGRVTVSWYLDVHVVDDAAQNVPDANVTAIYANATIAESKLTDMNGLTRLTLMEKILNVTGEYPIGNYAVEATLGIYSNNTSINVAGNQKTTLKLSDFVIPEFPILLLLSLFMMATLLATFICRKKWNFNDSIEV
jgi:hypothetical protein